jgi:hypothetical protein
MLDAHALLSAAEQHHAEAVALAQTDLPDSETVATLAATLQPILRSK